MEKGEKVTLISLGHLSTNKTVVIRANLFCSYCDEPAADKGQCFISHTLVREGHGIVSRLIADCKKCGHKGEAVLKRA